MKLVIAALAVCLALPFVGGAQDKSGDAIHEIETILAIAPNQRTKEQKETIRAIWRSNAQVRAALHGVAVLQMGDSVFDFPGIICGQNIEFDAAKRQYSIKASYSSRSWQGGKDHWVVRITVSEEGIVTGKQRLKVNSR